MPRRADRLSLSTAKEPPAAPPAPARARPWIAMAWTCCGAYSRIYRHPDADHYRGTCPRCGTPATLRVGEGGVSARFFQAG